MVFPSFGSSGFLCCNRKEMIRMMKKTVFLLSVLLLPALVIIPAAAWTLDSGYDSGASIYGGVRYQVVQ